MEFYNNLWCEQLIGVKCFAIQRGTVFFSLHQYKQPHRDRNAQSHDPRKFLERIELCLNQHSIIKFANVLIKKE